MYAPLNSGPPFNIRRLNRPFGTLPTKMEQTQEFWKLLLGGNLVVPLVDEDGATFVDANCLVGEYAMDLAREFPKAHIIGIAKEHNSPVAKPSNCTFVV